MDNLEGAYGARRVVFDVIKPSGDRDATPARRSRPRRRRKGGRSNDRPRNGQVALVPAAHTDDATDDPINPEQVPLELWPAIREILGYGRRIHALAALRAAAALSGIANRLRALDNPSADIDQIVIDAERESGELRALFSNSYTDDPDT